MALSNEDVDRIATRVVEMQREATTMNITINGAGIDAMSLAKTLRKLNDAAVRSGAIPAEGHRPRGGMVTRDQARNVIIGENGPEAVIPLRRA